jgi:DNA (cytosine-5)-methyltransferase 1
MTGASHSACSLGMPASLTHDVIWPAFVEQINNTHARKVRCLLTRSMACSALVQLGYQVSYGILQAGHYGVPQSRRRCFVLASRNEYVLQPYPPHGHKASRWALLC